MWTEEQAQAIELSGNLLVSAAAGAGKTAVLTERIVRIIAEGAKMDELLVVTFTRLAAAEMKQRIEKRLTELIKITEDSEIKKRLSAAAGSVFRANISTIDVFCRNVLKRCYHKIGLDPAFRTADDAEAELLMDKVLFEVLEKFYQSAEKNGDDASLFLIEALDGEDKLSSLIKNIYRFITARPEPLKKLSECVDGYSVNGGFDEAFKLASERFIRLAKRDIEVFHEYAKQTSAALSGMESGEKLQAVIFRDMEELMDLLRLGSYEGFYNALSEYKLSRLPSTPGGAPREIKKYREDLRKFIDKLKKMFALSKAEEERTAECLHPVLEKIFELVRDFSELFTAYKRENSLVDFEDMEQLCLTALSDEEVADEYRRSFSHIFIDEYQDTNSLQDAIFNRISRGDNLFMVGDVKQSIYRFRQAEPEIFLEKYRAYESARSEGGGKLGRRIDLNRNFRSVSAVLSATNRIFYALMKGEVGEIDYSDNAELRSSDDAGRGSVELHLVELSEQLYKNVDKTVENEDNSYHNTAFEDENAEKSGVWDEPEDVNSAEPLRLEELENVEAEAELIADRILDMMNNGSLTDKETKAPRKPRFSDFAVLMRVTRGFALRLVNALSRRGIPSSAELGDGFFDAVEVQVFINILRLIDNFRQDIPLASVLLSPVGEFSERELALMKSEFRSQSFKTAPFSEILFSAGAFCADVAGMDAASLEKQTVCRKAAAFIELILKYRALARRVELTELIGRIFDETRFALFAGALKNGAVRRANLDVVLERAAAFENIGGRSLHGFVKYLDSLRDNGRLGAAQAASGDAVRVMSIHKSKGLEFPVVFVCALTARFNSRDMSAPVILDRELGLGLRVNRGFYRLTELPPALAKNAGSSIIRRAIEAREREKLLAEEMRVLYVAMTRAKEKLVLVGAHKKMADFVEKNARELTNARIMGAGCFLEWILGALFPLGLNLENALRGVCVPVGEDRLTAFYELAGQGGEANEQIGREGFTAWLKAAAEASHEDIDARLGCRYPYLEDAATPAKTGVTDAIERNEEERPYEPAVPAFIREGGERRLTAAERGSLTHRFIMLLPIVRADRAALEERLSELIERGFFTPEEAKGIELDKVEGLTASPLYLRLIAAQSAGNTVKREQEFSLLLKSGAITQGIIDCFFEERGEWVLVDYKTTALKGRSARDAAYCYKPQLDAYQNALETLTGKRVREKWIFLLEIGEGVLVE